MVFEHAEEHASQWAAITSIPEKIGYAAETLRMSSSQRSSGYHDRQGAPAGVAVLT
jgi:hypothetical protein